MAARTAASEEAVAETYRFFPAHVLHAQQLTPSMRRVTFGGPALADLRSGGRDQALSLCLPHPGQDRPLVPVEDGSAWFTTWRAMDPTVRAVIRAYTVREHRTDAGELDIDFAMHGDHGPASRWAARTRPGDQVLLLGPARPDNPSIGFHPPPGADRVLLVADETALPAVAAVLAGLPAGMRALVWVEVPHAEDLQDLPTAADAEITWLVRGGPPAPGRTLLLDAVRAADLPADLPYAWVAGESGAVTSVRRHLVRERQLDRERITFCGYWRLAASQEDLYEESPSADDADPDGASPGATATDPSEDDDGRA